MCYPEIVAAFNLPVELHVDPIGDGCCTETLTERFREARLALLNAAYLATASKLCHSQESRVACQ